jgi:hypothetical protein
MELQNEKKTKDRENVFHVLLLFSKVERRTIGKMFSRSFAFSKAERRTADCYLGNSQNGQESCNCLFSSIESIQLFIFLI